MSIQSQGDMSGPLATWTAGDVLYVGADGTLTVTAPTSGWSVRVGIAVSSTQIIVVNLDPEWITPLVTLNAISAILIQAMTDVVASLPLTPSDQPGVLWRNQTFVALSPNLDGSAYTAPYGAGQGGALDAVTALLAVAVPRALAGLSVTPPSDAGVLWLNNGNLALSPNSDGTPYPVTPLPSTGSILLRATRAAFGPWLAATMPAMPMLSPISSGVLWRSTNLLAVS